MPQAQRDGASCYREKGSNPDDGPEDANRTISPARQPLAHFFAFNPNRVRLRDIFSRPARVLTATTDRFNFTETRCMEVLASRSVLSRSSSSGVHLFIWCLDTKLLPLRLQPSNGPGRADALQRKYLRT